MYIQMSEEYSLVLDHVVGTLGIFVNVIFLFRFRQWLQVVSQIYRETFASFLSFVEL